MRSLKWKTAIGTASATKMPTRLAYRWVKGLTGWQQSPIGEMAANDEVPDIDYMEEGVMVDEAFALNPAEELVKGKI